MEEELAKEEGELGESPSPPPYWLSAIGATFFLSLLCFGTLASRGKQLDFLPKEFAQALNSSEEPSNLALQPRFQLIMGAAPEKVTTSLNVVSLIQKKRYDKALRLVDAKSFPKTSETLELNDQLLELKQLELGKLNPVKSRKKVGEENSKTLDELLIETESKESADTDKDASKAEVQKVDGVVSEEVSEKHQQVLEFAKRITVTFLTPPEEKWAVSAYQIVSSLWPS